MPAPEPSSGSLVSIEDRLATIGRLAAALAHEFGNVMLPGRETLAALAQKSAPAAARELERVTLLIDFVRDNKRMLESLCVHAPVDSRDARTDVVEWWELTGNVLRKIATRAGLTWSAPADLPRVRIAGAALARVLIALLAEAPDRRVEITLSARDPGIAMRINGLPPGIATAPGYQVAQEALASHGHVELAGGGSAVVLLAARGRDA